MTKGQYSPLLILTAVEGYHEERRQNLRDTKRYVRNDRPQLGETSSRKQVHNRLPQIVVDQASIFHSGYDGSERVEKNHVGGFDGNVRAAAHCDTDISSLERGGIVDAVSRHANDVVALLKFLDDAKLLLGCGPVHC